MTRTNDPYDLQRFVDAQDPVIDEVKQELRTGRKRSHWMWYIFPQMEGLGKSEMAQRYAISSRSEAKAYLEHPILAPRLRECTGLVNETNDRSANEIFGRPDDLKFRSSMTLFEVVADDPALFRDALEQFFDGEPDPKTLELLADG
ncbi:DUF1810 domain-containing protein [Haloarchaeobius salinus]|uniref:DUF1810 domain-containing protein n=1 Tax=Haloarchaeobius salinus TaxID=1198298 RepID=UPI00210BE7E1|nr:DUF1810 domain-containing protein [Haloarchaeobius salinus]